MTRQKEYKAIKKIKFYKLQERTRNSKKKKLTLKNITILKINFIYISSSSPKRAAALDTIISRQLGEGEDEAEDEEGSKNFVGEDGLDDY